MTIFNEGDRVRIAGTESAIGTVTAHRSTGGFENFVGIHWDTGAFGFANPNKVVHAEPRDELTEPERQALGTAYERALDAVDPISFVTTTNAPTDWQTRAERAEAAIERVEAVYRHYDRHDRPRGVHRFSVAQDLRAALDADQ